MRVRIAAKGPCTMKMVCTDRARAMYDRDGFVRLWDGRVDVHNDGDVPCTMVRHVYICINIGGGGCTMVHASRTVVYGVWCILPGAALMVLQYHRPRLLPRHGQLP